MKRYAFLLGVVLIVFMWSGCSQDSNLAPDQTTVVDRPAAAAIDPELIAAELVARSGWAAETSKESGPATTGPGDLIITTDREVVVGDVVHYSYRIPVGPGPYDVIGLHRVVREARPNKPIRTRKAVFLQHGDAVGFTKFMFGVDAPSMPDDHAFAVFLAQNNVDVWGIDQNWILVPEATADFSFMASWDMQNQIDNLGIGMAVARFSRLATGNGWRKIHLLGYSSGVGTAYSFLNAETQLPPGLRNADGFIPVEFSPKTDVESERLRRCALTAANQDLIDSGVYQDPTGVLFRTIGMLAKFDPAGPSPLVPGLTNWQAALFAGGATYLLGGMDCCYHFVGATYDEYGIPTGLGFTQVDGWLDFLMNAASYLPLPWQADLYAIGCDELDLPYDDYFDEIANPVFYVGAGGGFGENGLYTTTLLGSTDVTSLIVQLYPPEAQILDFGHIDLWTADNAEALVWTPILDWINDHTPGEGEEGRFRNL